MRNDPTSPTVISVRRANGLLLHVVAFEHLVGEAVTVHSHAFGVEAAPSLHTAKIFEH